jgi:hypothetical protein
MPEATDEVLTKLVEEGPFQSYRLTGLRDTADARYLGVVGISSFQPIFHAGDLFPFSGELSPDSRYEIRVLRRAGEPSLVFVVFRQFDSSRYQAFPEDLVAGWVPAEEQEQARDWVHEMNNRIRAFPVEDHGGGPGGEAVNTHFAIRTRFTGTLRDLVTHVEAALGCQFLPSDSPGYGGQPAFQATSQGLRISLVESPPVAAYPRRFRMTGVPDRDDLPLYKKEVDLSRDMVDRLRRPGLEWYIASAEERRAELGSED